MFMQRVRPLVVGDATSRDPCARCDIRYCSGGFSSSLIFASIAGSASTAG